MSLPMKERHYPRIAGIVPRTEGDQSVEFMVARSKVTTVTLAERPKPAEPSLVSSSEGSIQYILLTVPTYAARGLAATYIDLFSKLPPYTSLVILVHEAAEHTVRRWIEEARLGDRAEIVVAPDHLHFSVWAEDGYVVVTDTSTDDTYFVEPFSFPRYGDSLIADFISNATHLRDSQAPVYFQGGNVLIGDDFFMIGADYPANSLAYLGTHLQPRPGEQAADLIRRLYREYLDTRRNLIYVASTIPVPKQDIRPIVINGQQWREVLYFGNKEGTAQPLFHIDMFITLIGRSRDGRFRLLVGDPELASKALGTPLQPHAMKEVFDNIARGLSSDFDVIRNPMPLVYVDDPLEKLRIWYFATTNNALVQNSDEDGRIVWLPTYGHGSWSELRVTDEANAQIWRSLDYEVRQLGDFHPFAENLGALHCIKKYLRRGTNSAVG